MVIRGIMKALRLGKYRYYAGSDLQGNQFFDYPNPRSADWRHAKRTVEYVRKLPLSEYGPDSLPPQWLSWLRRTRKAAPTIEELEREEARRARLEENVKKLELAYRDEKLRLEKENSVPELVAAPPRQRARGDRPTDTTKRQDGLPNLEMSQDEAQKATELGLGQDEVESEISIEARKQQAEREKQQLRKRFARENPDRPATSQKEAESWTPQPAPRRR